MHSMTYLTEETFAKIEFGMTLTEVFHMRTIALYTVTLWLILAPQRTSLAQVEQPEKASTKTSGNTILVAEIVDDTTGQPIDSFTALPGVGRLKDFKFRWQWQPHQIHEFKSGELIWPPTGKRAYRVDQALRIEADGYLPFITPTIRQSANINEKSKRAGVDQPPEPRPPIEVAPGAPGKITVRLQRDKGISGQVVDAGGSPMAGATVAVGTINFARGNWQNIHIARGNIHIWPKPSPNDSLRKRWERPKTVTTDKNGQFKLPSLNANVGVVAVHENGIAVGTYQEMMESPTLKLEPWARIEGQAIWNDKPAANERIRLYARRHSNEAVTDENGRFAFDKVPPGKVSIGRNSGPKKSNVTLTNPSATLQLLPGMTTQCVLGGRGRPVVGTITGFTNWQDVSISIHLNRRWPSNSFRSKDDPTVGAFHRFISSDYYRHYDKKPIGIAEDGSFHVDDVPAESWAIVVREVAKGKPESAVVNQGEGRFVIPMMPTGASDEPKDIGKIEISPNKRITLRKISPRNKL